MERCNHSSYLNFLTYTYYMIKPLRPCAVITLLLLPTVLPAADICQQENINELANTYPKIKVLVQKHESEQEQLEKKIEILSGKSETALDEDMQTEKDINKLDQLVTEEFRNMAERQYAEFWELCSELIE